MDKTKANMMLNTLVVDDDPIICDLINHFCLKSGLVENNFVAENASQGLFLINKEKIDLIFLDFDLPDLNGEQFLDLISVEFPVVMVTSNANFAAKSYNYPNVIDYLVKPIDYQGFIRSLHRQKDISVQVRNPNSHLFVKDGNKLVKLNFEEVLYIKSEGNYVNFIEENRQVMSLMTMKTLDKLLPPFFVRVHRSYIINTHHIDYIHLDSIQFKKKSVPFSSTYKEQLLKKLNLH